MGTIYFREEQPAKQTFIPLIMIPIWLLSAVFFGVAFYQQLVLGKPWGDNPMSNNGLLITGISVITGLGVLVSILFVSSLITEVHSDGFYFKFSPFINRMRRIPLEQIASAEVRKLIPFSDRREWGIHRHPLRRTISYNVGGNKAVVITTTTGRRFMFGTSRMEEMRKAIDKMMAGKSNHTW